MADVDSGGGEGYGIFFEMDLGVRFTVLHLDVLWYYLNGMGTQTMRPRVFSKHNFHAN